MPGWLLALIVIAAIAFGYWIGRRQEKERTPGVLVEWEQLRAQCKQLDEQYLNTLEVHSLDVYAEGRRPGWNFPRGGGIHPDYQIEPMRRARDWYLEQLERIEPDHHLLTEYTWSGTHMSYIRNEDLYK